MPENLRTGTDSSLLCSSLCAPLAVDNQVSEVCSGSESIILLSALRIEKEFLKEEGMQEIPRFVFVFSLRLYFFLCFVPSSSLPPSHRAALPVL